MGFDDIKRAGEDKILTAIILADKPLRLSEIAEATGLSPPSVKYWLPRMISKGILLKIENEGSYYYMPQAIFIGDFLSEVLGEVYIEVIKRHKNFFDFSQASVPVESVIKSCISKSLKLFCIDIKEIDI